MKNYKVVEFVNQKDFYTKKDGMNYLVCQMGKNIGYTKRMDEAIQLMEANLTSEAIANDIRIHEFASGNTWYVE